jgi:hypothetical protein
MGAVDSDTGNDPDEVNHINSIDIWVVADVWRFLCGQFKVLTL